MHLKRSFSEKCRFTVIYNIHIVGLIIEEDALFRKTLHTRINKVRDARILFLWSVLAQLQKKREYVLLLDHERAN